MLHREIASTLALRDDGDGRILHGPLLPWGVEARVLDRGRLVVEVFERGRRRPARGDGEFPMTRRPGDPAATSRGACSPQYATPRDPRRKTLGSAVAKVAKALGTPFMPWQRQVADVALEIDPRTGRLAYREVVVTTPREQGKTRLELAVLVHRARTWPGSRMLYAAQDRIHARAKWGDDHLAALQRSRFAGELRPRFQRGDEAIRWHNGSWHGITAPGEKAGHSDVLDVAVVDEVWALEAGLEHGLSLTMVTRPQPQLWVVSTAGTLRSAYLRGKVERGREGALHNIKGSTAYFEWGAPEGTDPGDVASRHAGARADHPP
jgi:hypothetical protein